MAKAKAIAKPAPERPKAGTSKQSAEDRRKRFVEAFLANGNNKTQAAITAGFSKKGAERAGTRLSSDSRVKAEIEKRQAELFNDLEITTERILKERARLAFFDPQKLYDSQGRRIPIHKLDKDTAAAIAGIEHGKDGVKIRLADKNAHLTSLEKQRGMYKADNEQQTPATIDPATIDRIEAARAIAYVLAKASRLKKKKNAGEKPS